MPCLRRTVWVVLPWLALLAVLTAWLGLIRHYAIAPGWELELDALYHVRMADLGPAACWQRTFPATTMSIWHEHFHDKELGFHLLLAAVRRVAGALGAKPAPPFTVPALVLGGLLLAVALAVGRAWRLPLLPLLLTGLVVIAPDYTCRILMVRPHVLAIALLLGATWAMSRVTRWRQAWVPAVLGGCFVYTYSNPHFVLLPVTLFALLRWRQDWRLALALPALAVAGLVLGFTLHPQVPNGFRLWWVQCVLVVWQIVSGSLPIGIGTETAAPGRGWLVANLVPLLLLPLLNLALAWRLHRRTPLWQAPCETQALLLMHLLAAAGCWGSMRALEYAVPFGLFALGLLLRDLGLAAGLAAWPRQRQWVAGLAGGAAAGLLLLGMAWLTLGRLYPGGAHPYTQFGAWARRHLPAGTAVANPQWSDFPGLFYSAPEYHYSVGIEPLFGYAWDAQRTTALDQFSIGALPLRPSQVAALTGARYIFLSTHAVELSRRLYQEGYVILFQDDADGWVFDLAASAQHRQQLGLPP